MGGVMGRWVGRMDLVGDEWVVKEMGGWGGGRWVGGDGGDGCVE